MFKKISFNQSTSIMFATCMGPIENNIFVFKTQLKHIRRTKYLSLVIVKTLKTKDFMSALFSFYMVSTSTI